MSNILSEWKERLAVSLLTVYDSFVLYKEGKFSDAEHLLAYREPNGKTNFETGMLLALLKVKQGDMTAADELLLQFDSEFKPANDKTRRKGTTDYRHTSC